MNKTLNELNLWDYFHDKDTGHGSIKAHLLILYSIVIGYKPGVIVEIGMKHGDSTKALLLAAKEVSAPVHSIDCGVYSIDCIDYPGTIKEIESLGLSKWHFFIKGYSEIVGRKWEHPIDILLIDAGHHYEEHKLGFDVWYPKVKSGGIILIHDIDSDKPHLRIEGHKHFTREILPEYESCRLMFGGGLGIIRKK